MAIEKVITIKGDTKSAVKSFDELTATIQEQKDITIEFERELQKLEQQLKDTGKAAFNPKSKQIKDDIVNIKGAIKDQKISLKSLNNERSKSSKITKINTESLSKNYGVVQLLDQVTGGLASQVRSVVDANRIFNISLKATRTALIATGVGAFVVALGLVVTYWDDIIELIGGANKELQKQIDLGKSNIIKTNKQREALKLQRDILKNQGKDLGEINILLEKNLQKEIKLVEANLIKLKQQSTILTDKALEITLAEKLLGLVSQNYVAVVNLTKEEKKAIEARAKEIQDAEISLLKLQKTESEGAKAFRDSEEEYDKIKAKKGKAAADAWQALQDKKFAAYLKEDALIVKRLEEEAAQIEKDRQQIADDFELLEGDEEARVELENLRLENLGKFYENKDALDKIAAEKEIKIEEDKVRAEQWVQDAKKHIKLQEIDNVSNIVGLIASLGKESKALQVAAIIAEAGGSIAKTIITTQSANAAITAQGLALAIPSAGSSVVAATGLVAANNVSSGISVALQAAAAAQGIASLGGGGSVNAGSNNGGGQEPAAPSFNLVQGTGANQIAQGLAGQNQPIKAFVVSSDVSSSQSLDRNIVENSSL